MSPRPPDRQAKLLPNFPSYFLKLCLDVGFTFIDKMPVRALNFFLIFRDDLHADFEEWVITSFFFNSLNFLFSTLFTFTSWLLCTTKCSELCSALNYCHGCRNGRMRLVDRLRIAIIATPTLLTGL